MNARPIPEHGTPARYAGNSKVKPCRCDACRKVAVRQALQCTVERNAGNPRRVPAGPIWAHILKLRARGLSDAEITRAANIHGESTIGKIRHQKTVGRDNAKAILSVPLDYWPEDAGVPTLGASRRVQALMAIAHSGAAIAERANTEHWRIFKLTSGQRIRISAELDAAIRDVYEQLRHEPGDCPRIATIAKQNGWHGPGAWDDIDDPDEQPGAELHLTAREQAEERLADIVLLASGGATPAEIAERTGLSRDYVRDRLKAARPTTLLALTA